MLRRDAPIDLDLTNIAALGVKPDLAEVKRLFEFLEFRSLFDRLAEVLGRAHRRDPPVPGAGHSRGRRARCRRRRGRAHRPEGRGRPVSIGPFWVGVAGRSDLVGLAFATGDEAAVWVPSAVLADDDVRGALGAAALGRPARRRAPTKPRRSMRSLLEIGLDLRSLELDTSIAAYLLDPAESRYAISDLLCGTQRSSSAPTSSDELQLDLDGSSVDDSMVAGASTRWPPRGRACARERTRASGDADAVRRRSRTRSSGCSRAWSESAWASTSWSCARSTIGSEPSAAAQRRSRRRRARSST